MAPLPPPPVPQRLREMLKDYPGHIERLQEVLNKGVEKPSPVTPPFEVAIWMLEGATEEFIQQAREELKAAEASGDAAVIGRAKEKEFLMGRASVKGRWIGDEGLWEYFQRHRGALK